MRFHRVHESCIGPHPLPMWEADFACRSNAEHWDEVVSWLAREHGTLSILVHPHSIDGSWEDHTRHAKWIGKKLQLRMRRPSAPSAEAASSAVPTRPVALGARALGFGSKTGNANVTGCAALSHQSVQVPAAALRHSSSPQELRAV